MSPTPSIKALLFQMASVNDWVLDMQHRRLEIFDLHLPKILFRITLFKWLTSTGSSV